MSAALSRRSAIGALAAMPVLIAAASPHSLTAHPSRWKEAFARWRAAEAAWDHFLETAYNPAIEELDARAFAPPPSFMVAARSGATNVYLFDPAEPDAWTDNLSNTISEPARKLRDQWAQYDRDYKAAREALRIDELSAEEDRLSATSAEARYQLMATPVANAAELLEKIEIAWGVGCDPDLFRSEILSDLRALAGKDS